MCLLRKTTLLLLCVAMSFTLSAQNVNIPDPILKDFLVNHTYHSFPGGSGYDIPLDSNGDGEISYEEAENYPANLTNYTFYLNGLGISDLTGIEAFKSIKGINASNNQLTAINVDGCTSLEMLNCSQNPIESLVINNAAVKEVIANACPSLFVVNLGGCPALENLGCGSNDNLTTLNLIGCTVLEEMRVNFNPLLTTIHLSFYQDNLTYFQGVSGGLMSLDFSSCSALSHLQVSNNQLTSLNLANGSMQSFGYIDVSGNPDLTCITVDNVVVADFLWGDGYPFIFDAGVNFDTDCTPAGPCVVNIPDATLKAALLADTSINTDENNEIECTEAIAYTGELNLDDLQVSDWTGIEAFVNITSFSSNNNQTGNIYMHPVILDTLNLSDFTSLTSISCIGNVGLEYLNASGCTALTSINVNTSPSTDGVALDLAGCTALTDLNLTDKRLNALNLNGCSALETIDCSNNQLHTLSVDGCTVLNSLNCSKNQLTTLDVASSVALTTLNCADNQLTDLSTINNINLTELDCGTNQLTYLFVTPNTALTTLKCNDNLIGYLDVGNNTILEYLNCNNNELNTIAVNNNPVLTTLLCDYNNLPTIDVSNNTDLLLLSCSNNQLTNIGVSDNLELETLRCNNNNLSNIDVSNNLALRTLWCAGNGFPDIDVSNNLVLKQLECSDNQLNTLNVTANSELSTLVCKDNQLTTLNLQSNPELVVLECTNNQLTDLDLSLTYIHVLYCESNDLQTLNLANGHNATAAILFANDNPNLTCIQVDDADFSTANWTGGNFNFDPEVSFSENCVVGTNNAEQNDSFIVYPNPTSGMVYFSELTNIRVFDSVGQIVESKKNVSSLDLSGQPAGIYFVAFTDHRGHVSQRRKIVKK